MSRQGTIRRYTLIIEKTGANQYPTAAEILSHLHNIGFEISQRTFERDLSAIRNEFGIEIVHDTHRKGYYIDKENSLNFDSFMRFLEIVNTAELLTQSLTDSKETLGYISFDQGGGLKGIDFLKPLLQAIKENRKIKFAHFSYQSEKTRKFGMKPYLLKEYQNRWYIVGVVSGMNEIRTFGLDRISDLQITDAIFTPDKNVDAQNFFSSAIGVAYSDNKPQRVVLQFTKDQGYYVKSLPLHSSQEILVDTEDECRIALHVVPNYELMQMVWMHHDQVKVLEPEWLVDNIKNQLKKAYEQY